jgi:hypothetical protein
MDKKGGSDHSEKRLLLELDLPRQPNGNAALGTLAAAF